MRSGEEKRRTSNAQHPTSNEEGRKPASGVGRWTLNVEHSFSSRFPPCASLRPALTVPNLMRLFLRRAALILATGSLVFFLSCERHSVDELPVEQETKAPAKEHASTHESHTSP